MTPAPGWTIWFTGLPASGKSTLARALQAALAARGVQAVVLDSDALRPVLAPSAGYTPTERDEFYRQLVALAALLVQQGVNVIIAATANRAAHRAPARRLPRYLEVWVRRSPQVCQARDPKGLYAGARQGRVQHLPGVDAVYEPPDAPDWVVDSDHVLPHAAVAALLQRFAWLAEPAPPDALPSTT